MILCTCGHIQEQHWKHWLHKFAGCKDCSCSLFKEAAVAPDPVNALAAVPTVSEAVEAADEKAHSAKD